MSSTRDLITALKAELKAAGMTYGDLADHLGMAESSINRLIGRRMCKDQHMRWSRDGADGVVQVRVALQNQELDALSRQHFEWSGSRRISWPWMQASHPF